MFFVTLGLILTQQERVPSRTGVIETLPAVRSEALGNSRDVLVYLPPQYKTDPRRRFPVMYLHDGQNVFDGATSFIPNQEWKADEAAQGLIESGLIEPLILVAIPNMGLERGNEYLPTLREMQGQSVGGKADLYLKFVAHELKPLVDAKFRTKPGREDTALCGSSFGGIATLHLGLKAPEVFGKLAVVSPSVWWDDRVILKAIRAFKGPRPKVWVDMGTNEGKQGVEDARALRDALIQAGWTGGKDLLYFEDGFAGHNEAAWARRFPLILTFLFGKR